METKSRYEVIADLEKQKRDLVRERDKLDDDLRDKAKIVVNLGRNKLDIERQKLDFGLIQTNAKQDLERQQADFDFKIKNTEDSIDRKTEDAQDDVLNFEKTITKRRDTIKELIKGVDESLERFGKLPK